MKKGKLILILIICFIVGFFAFRGYTDYKNKQIVSQEICTVINEGLQDFYDSDDAKEYGINNVEYEITSIKRTRSYISDYNFAVEFRCTTNKSLNETEKSLAAYAVEDLVGTFDAAGQSYKMENGLRVGLRDLNTQGAHTNTYINGELVHRNGGISSSSSSTSNSSSKDSKTKKCKVCGREFNMGTDDSWSITTRNMCVNCYKNYKAAEEMLDDMKHN